MKKLLLIMLLTIVGGVECICKAQNISREKQEQIINYVNCFYTARYILAHPDLKQENKGIKDNGIDTISIEKAYQYAKLDSILKANNMQITADSLTKKLKDRNVKCLKNSGLKKSVEIVEFVYNVADTKKIEKFKITREDERELERKILSYIFQDEENSEEQNKQEDEEVGETKVQEQNSEAGLPIGFWILLGSVVFCLVAGVAVLFFKLLNREHELDNKKTSYRNLEKDVDKLKQKNKELDDKIKKLEKDSKEKNKEKDKEKNKENVVTDDTQQEVVNNTVETEENVVESPMELPISEEPVAVSKPVFYYADVDVSDDCFVRVNENKTKKSVYQLNVNQRNFVLIDDEQLYEVKLSRVGGSGITDACEVKGAYQKGKTVSVTPGKVVLEDNGKWKIVDKAKIEIK
ncbi:hypothetical protein [Bacteroides finegoldii]|uniref:hypothetical protein n=1 Tax=Bacteroides finegoldii TaxID=338188 RepID=UPI00189C9713|nr:hypothetical protein [Bacteroides finegoldii]